MSKYWANRNWYWFHIITFTIPDEFDSNPNKLIKKYYYDLFALMINLIPCNKCLNNFKKYIISHPINLNSKKDIIQWFIDAHNDVNKSLNKPIIDTKEVYNIYFDLNTDLNLEKEETNNLDNNQDNEKNEKYKLKPFNHLFLNQYIKYHLDRAFYGHSSIKMVIIMIDKLIKIYPCNICRKILIEYNNKNPIIYNLSKPVSLKKWYNNFFEYQNQNLSNHFSRKWKNM